MIKIVSAGYNVVMHTIPISLEEKVAMLSQNRYFEGLDEFIWYELAKDTVLRFFARGEMLFWQDEPCAGLHIIRQGSIKLFKLSPRGREHIINVFDTGGSFSEVPVYDNLCNPVNAAALEDCQVWIVGAGTIRRLTFEYPQMAQAVILNLCKNLRFFVSQIEELSFYQVTNRLARLIYELPPEQLWGPENQRITQDQMAARVGTVREVVARALKDLENSGAIRIDRRRIRVVDESLLLEIAQPTD